MVTRSVRSSRGFTIIEMLVVLASLALLLSVAAPVYLRHLDRAAEVTLRESLQTVRMALDQYAADRGQYPETLNDLVSAGYLRAVPVDPMTGRPDWVFVRSAPGDGPAVDAGAGIRDLHSASARSTKEGTRHAAF